MQQLIQSYTPKVEHCTKGLHKGTFHHGIEIDTPLGRRRKSDVTEAYSFIKKVHVRERHVEMYHKSSPLLSLSLQHRHSVGVVAESSGSNLDDFTGLLYQDNNSHLYLNLSLLQASGTITGVVSGFRSSQSILLNLPLIPSNVTRQVKVTAVECRAGQVLVNLRPLRHSHLTISKQLPCISETLRSFRSTSFSKLLVSDRSSLSLDCLSCGRVWLYWLNPDTWLDPTWPQARLVILATMFCIALVILAIMCRLTALICRCCGCGCGGHRKIS